LGIRADSVEKRSGFDVSSQVIALISLRCGSLYRSSSCGWYHGLELGQFPEVLGGGCEGEFVLNTAWPAQSEPPQTENAFEVGEEHLDFLASRLCLGIEL
jgi:hypothetical protein